MLVGAKCILSSIELEECVVYMRLCGFSNHFDFFFVRRVFHSINLCNIYVCVYIGWSYWAKVFGVYHIAIYI